MPANPPAVGLLVVDAYDTDTRSMVQNTTNDAARLGYDQFEANNDGSIDLYFGPERPVEPEEELDRNDPRQRLLPYVPLL